MVGVYGIRRDLETQLDTLPEGRIGDRLSAWLFFFFFLVAKAHRQAQSACRLLYKRKCKVMRAGGTCCESWWGRALEEFVKGNNLKSEGE